MITYKTFTKPDEIKFACQMARTYRLAVPGWSFFDIFDQIVKGKKQSRSGWSYSVDKVTLAYDGDKPVAVTLNFRGWGLSNIGTFVKRAYRKKGVGSGLIKAHADPVRGQERTWHEGCKGSSKFWHKQSEGLRVIKA